METELEMAKAMVFYGRVLFILFGLTLAGFLFAVISIVSFLLKK